MHKDYDKKASVMLGFVLFMTIIHEKSGTVCEHSPVVCEHCIIVVCEFVVTVLAVYRGIGFV